MQFVRLTDWVAILSGLICYADIGRDMGRVTSPIEDPPLIAEFVVISPARKMLSTQAELFLQIFEAEIARIQEVWAQTIPPAVYPVRRRRASSR
jgi:LysR family transcriptional regulator, nitrogen assimilation regulatory protein